MQNRQRSFSPLHQETSVWEPESTASRAERSIEVGSSWGRRSWGLMFHAMAGSLSWLGQHHPALSLRKNRIERIRDLAYLPTTKQRAHTLDVYRPMERRGELPVLVYVHGGAFQMLSKETHWFMGSLFARRGYVVFNLNYRLAPIYRYPAAIQDVSAAFHWILEHAREFGANPESIVLAGESAGCNLVTALAVASCYEKTETWAESLWQAKPNLRAVIAACGVLQTSDMERFSRRKPLPRWLHHRLSDVYEYLPNAHHATPMQWLLADPLCILEQRSPQRALPPFFAFAGTSDPILDDTRRLKRALDAHSTHCEARYYEGGIHAFHALLWQKQAQQCWRDQFAFLADLGLPA